MRSRTRRLWQGLLAGEAPASLLPQLYARGARGERARRATPVWARARGAWVWDSDGRRYLDFVAGFGAAAVGHAHPQVTRAIARQARRLVHGFGDVQPHEGRAELVRRLAALGPWRDTRVLWAQSGSEAIELAWKTAWLATGRPGIVVFEGAYHGSSLGVLPLAGRADFRAPFAPLLASRHVVRVPYPDRKSQVRQALARAARSAARGQGVGAVLVEPVLGRGGPLVPPPGFLGALRRETRRRGWLLIADEVYTGFGRTGRLFACDHEGVAPDLLCVGKALGGGMPIAAVLGPPRLLRAWRRAAPAGEAAHSATFLAHPISCAAALATLEVMRRERLPARAERLGRRLRRGLDRLARGDARIAEVRGIGMLAGLEIARAGGSPDARAARAIMAAALEERLLVLTGGTSGNVLCLSPPLVITETQLDDGLARLARALRATRAG